MNGHLTIAPPDDDINNAITRIMKCVLHKGDAWLLTIPRSIGYTGTLSAKAIFSDQGGAALVLPKGIFGMIYVLNEIVFELKEATHSRLPKEMISFIKANYPEILGYVLLQKQQSDSSIPLFVTQLDRFRYERNRSEWSMIFSYSMSQQLYVILHEFGHIVHGRQTSRNIVTEGVYEHFFCGREQEEQADTWAAKYLHKGHSLTDDWPYWKSTQIALIILFGAIDLLRESHFLEIPDRDELALRLGTLLLTPEMSDNVRQISISYGHEMLSYGRRILWGGG